MKYHRITKEGHVVEVDYEDLTLMERVQHMVYEDLPEQCSHQLQIQYHEGLEGTRVLIVVSKGCKHDKIEHMYGACKGILNPKI